MEVNEHQRSKEMRQGYDTIINTYNHVVIVFERHFYVTVIKIAGSREIQLCISM